MATAIHQYEDKLLDFAYGELPPPEASAVESHVKSCTRCTQALAQIRGVRASMSVLPTLAAPDAGLDSLLAYAEQAAARNAKVTAVPWWRRFIAPAAGVLALSLVVVVAVRIDGEGDLNLSKKAAMAEMKKSEESAAAKIPADRSPAPVAAAPIPALDEAKTEKGEAEVWGDSANKQGALAKNADGYEQQLGATRGREENRAMAQQKDLGDVLKQSKTRRDMDDNFGNARGGYTREKELDRKSKKPAQVANDKIVSAKEDEAKVALPPPPQAQPAPPPAPATQIATKEAPPAPEKSQRAEESVKREVAVAEKPAESKPAPRPSMGFGLSNAGPSGSSSSGGSYGGSAYGTKAPTVARKSGAESSDDDLAGRGASSIADSKRMKDDAQADQAALEHDARPHLDAARAAGNASNHQEEVKQALYVLNTGVKGVYRAEALSRLCNTLTELGNEGQADKYCDALLTEFPNTAAAKVLAQRRANMQAGKTAKKSAPANYDEAERAAEPSPAKAKKAEPAPAATSY